MPSRRSYRVLMIAPTSFFSDYGCCVRIREEARALQELGHEVVIVTYYKGRDVAGLTIRRTLPLPWHTHYEVGASRHKVAFDAFLGLTTLGALLRRRPDVIHAHLHEGALIGGVLGRLRGVPLVFDFQGSMTGEMVDHHFLNPNGVLYHPLRRLEWAIDRLPQAIITSSHHAADVLAGEFGCGDGRVFTVPDCVNADFFYPRRPGDAADVAALKASLGIPPDRPVVAYLGLLAEYQGTGLLLQAAVRLRREMPDVHFLIMGYPGETFYRQQTAQLGLADHVTFTGKIPYDEAPRYLALGDVAVSPKISATEGSGKLLNYMAMALPTAAFDTSVHREYLGEDGVYAAVGDAAGLAAALRQLLTDGQAAAERGARLRARALAEYTWEQAGAQIQHIYDLVGARHSLMS
jgi:glycosyltransferase involved in cell wall biosynthesis